MMHEAVSPLARGSTLKPYSEYAKSAKKSTVKKSEHDEVNTETPTRNKGTSKKGLSFPSAFVAASGVAALSGLLMAHDPTSTPTRPSLPSPFPSPLPSHFDTPTATPHGLGGGQTPSNYDLPVLQGKYKKAKRLLQISLKENEALRTMLAERDEKATEIQSKFSTERVLLESRLQESQARVDSVEGDKRVLQNNVVELERQAFKPPSPSQAIMVEDGNVDSVICELLRETIFELKSSLEASEDQEGVLSTQLKGSREELDELKREIARREGDNDERAVKDQRLAEQEVAAIEGERSLRLQLEDVVRSHQEEIEALKHRAKEREDLMTARINQLMIQMEKEAQQTRTTTATLEAESKGLRDEIRQQKARMTEIKSDLDQLSRDKEGLESALELQAQSFGDERLSMQESFCELQKMMDSSQDNQEHRFSSLEILQSEHEKSMGQLQALHKQGMAKLYFKIEKERSEWVDRERGLLSRGESAEAACREFEALLGAHEAELLKMRREWADEVAALESSLASLGQLHRESKADQGKAREEASKSKVDLIKAKEEASEKAQAYAEVATQMEERLSELADEYALSQRAVLEAQASSKGWEERVMQLQADLELSRESLTETKDTLMLKEREVIMARIEIDSLVSESEDVRSLSSSLIHSLSSSIHRLMSETNRQQTLIHMDMTQLKIEADSGIKGVSFDIREVQSLLNDLTKHNGTVESCIGGLRSDLDLSERDRIDLVAQINASHSLLERLEIDRASDEEMYKQRIEAQMEDKKILAAKLAQLQEEVRVLKTAPPLPPPPSEASTIHKSEDTSLSLPSPVSPQLGADQLEERNVYPQSEPVLRAQMALISSRILPSIKELYDLNEDLELKVDPALRIIEVFYSALGETSAQGVDCEDRVSRINGAVKASAADLMRATQSDDQARAHHIVIAALKRPSSFHPVIRRVEIALDVSNDLWRCIRTLQETTFPSSVARESQDMSAEGERLKSVVVAFKTRLVRLRLACDVLVQFSQSIVELKEGHVSEEDQEDLRWLRWEAGNTPSQDQKGDDQRQGTAVSQINEEESISDIGQALAVNQVRRQKEKESCSGDSKDAAGWAWETD